MNKKNQNSGINTKNTSVLANNTLNPQVVSALNNQNSMKVAISYIRFSSQEQRQGDSYRRQLANAQEYAKNHNLSLVDLTISDLGVSAFRGRNIEKGALSTFLSAVESGQIPRDCTLLVESHDRLSRMPPEEALQYLIGITNSGVTVVTLADRQVYKKGELDTTKLLVSILSMHRAHEESATKAMRQRSNIERGWKRAIDGGGRIKIGRIPEWLVWADKEKTQFKVRNVESVKIAFDMYLAGHGAQAIAIHLNEHKQSKPGGKHSKWDASRVCKLLRNRQFIGELYIKAADKTIENYFPRVIDVNKFNAAQAIMNNKQVSSGVRKERMRNLFSGLLRCGCCGSTMTIRTSALYHYVCYQKHQGGGCNSLYINQSKCELLMRAALAHIPEIIAKSDSNKQKELSLICEIESIKAEIDLGKEKENKLTDLILENEESLAYKRKLKQVEDETCKLEQRLKEKKVDLNNNAMSITNDSRFTEVLSVISCAETCSDLTWRKKFNLVVNSIFSRIVVSFNNDKSIRIDYIDKDDRTLIVQHVSKNRECSTYYSDVGFDGLFSASIKNGRLKVDKLNPEIKLGDELLSISNNSEEFSF